MIVPSSNSSRSVYSGNFAAAHGLVRIQIGHADLQTFVRTLPHVVVETHAVRRRKIGQLALAEFQREVAALGDFDAVGQRLGQVGEQFRHFVRRLEILLGGERPRTARIAQHHALGDAHARLVRLEIVRREELDRMGGHRRQIQRRADVQQAVDQAFGVRLAEALQFQVIASGKQSRPRCGCGARGIGFVVENRLRHVAAVAARQGQQAVAAFGQPGGIDLGTATMDVVLIGPREQFAQATIAFAMLHQQQQARRPIAVGGIADPHVAAEDGLDPRAARRAIELHPAKGVRQIGQAQRRHRDVARALDRPVHPHQAIGDGVFGVQAEMDETRVGHRETAEKQTRILTPGQDAQKQKAAEAAF